MLQTNGSTGKTTTLLSAPASKWGRNPTVRIRTGRRVSLLHPKASDWWVPDIAWHLAGVNRYTGGSRLTVAQHSVVGALMAERYYPSHTLLPAKMMIHDAHESVYGDVSSPLKSLLPDYKRIEQNAELTIEEAFDLNFVDDPLVKEIDIRLFMTERQFVYTEGADDTDGEHLEPFPTEDMSEWEWWSPRVAEEEYLCAFRRLLPWVSW